jgi:Family of unknown function (DUF6479)
MRPGMKLFVMEAAGSGGSAGIIALVIGVIVVLGLIAAFVLGSRRKEKEPPPAGTALGSRPDAGGLDAEGLDAGGPDAQGPPPPAAKQGSWSTPPSTPGRAPQGEDAPPQEER